MQRHTLLAARRNRGFTLIELLIAITVMALMAVMAWRGLDGMLRVQTQTSQQTDNVLTLQAGLAQWKLDLDMLSPTPDITSLDWDGSVLRMTRQAALVSDGMVVTAWMRRADAGGQWLRWQSPAVLTFADWRQAWTEAAAWSKSASPERKRREVAIVPLQDWQIFYFRGDAWTNPLSNGAPSAQAQTDKIQTFPDGIRLILTLPQSQVLSGKLTLDWVRPNLNREK